MTYRITRTASLLLSAAIATAPSAATAQRARESIDRGWRFTRDDPPGLAVELGYDARPAADESGDAKPADTRPEAAAAAVARGDRAYLKPWILPTANPLVADPARRHVRPAGDPGADVAYVRPGFDDRGWTAVDLPHDWAIAGPFIKDGPHGGMGRLPSWGVGWYRRAIDVPKASRGRRLFLDVDGAMSYATVWLNGRLVGGWPYGYNGWRLDLTPYAVPGGRNVLAIRLDNPPASARWYPGGGLYRDVWLTRTDPVHVAHWGSTVTTPRVAVDRATVAVRLRIDNDTGDDAAVSVATTLHPLGSDGRRGAAVATIAPLRLTLPANGSGLAEGSTVVLAPRLWGPPPTQTPNLYVAVSTVRRGGRVVDRFETRFGIREVRMDPDKGVIVNGEPIRLRGVNNHHDLGAIGTAWNRRAAERQLEILRDMGTNALRMSHNPPAPGLLDLADEMGFLVVDEVFDSWERKKTPLDFHLVFPDWHEPDLRAMLRRDRNHPSVILWSHGNEVGEQYTGEDGARISRELIAIVREEDPTRPVTNAMNYAKADMPLPATVDVISLNYQGAGIRGIVGQYPAFRARFPDKLILSSESASALSSRGEYIFPVAGNVSGPVRPWSGGNPDTHQVSAYEMHAADFGSSPDRVWAADDQNPFVAGEFVWTGFDYLGEPTPYYSSRSSYSGIVDLAGFAKDRYWLYRSRWRPDLRFAHILPHWNWAGREGQVTPVHVFSSADEAELFVNGKSQGRVKKRDYEYRFRWDYVTWAPGELRVETWKAGQPWASATGRTTGPAARIVLTPDRARIAGDGRDLSFVTATVVDADGAEVPDAKPLLTFALAGAGSLAATDNGDPTDLVAFPSATRAAFNGRALAIVRGSGGGTVTVRATAPGLVPGEATITVARSAAPPTGRDE